MSKRNITVLLVYVTGFLELACLFKQMRGGESLLQSIKIMVSVKMLHQKARLPKLNHQCSIIIRQELGERFLSLLNIVYKHELS